MEGGESAYSYSAYSDLSIETGRVQYLGKIHPSARVQVKRGWSLSVVNRKVEIAHEHGHPDRSPRIERKHWTRVDYRTENQKQKGKEEEPRRFS